MGSKLYLALAVFFALTTTLLSGILIGKQDASPMSSALPPCEPVITYQLAEFPAFRDNNGNCAPSNGFADAQMKIVDSTGKIGNEFVCSLMYNGNKSYEKKCIEFRKNKYPKNPD